jgi:YesN/AraC family two-component response regulator
MSKLLVVDDEAMIRESLATLLEDQGHVVDTAPGAIEGWKLVDDEKYDLILTDLEMPEIDGFEFIKQVRV